MYGPNCGRLISDNRKKKKKSKPVTLIITMTVGLISILCLLIIIGMFKAQNTNGNNSRQKAKDPISAGGFNDVDAFTCAEDIVKHNLKSPSTAKFCKITEATCTYDSSTNYWTVKGWVDAENSFGAMIRQNWTVKFQPVVKVKMSAMNTERAVLIDYAKETKRKI